MKHNGPLYYCKKPKPGELDALKDEHPLSKKDLEDMPRIVRKFIERGLITFRVNVPAINHKAK